MTARWTKVAAMGALCAAATTVRGQEESPAVPSGLILTLQEILEEPQPDGTLWLRLRYVAPDLPQHARAAIAGDFESLCASQALPYAPVHARQADEAVISIASEPIEFGTTAPDVTQFFEVYRLQDGLCILEAF